MKSVVAIISLALIAAVYTQDIVISGTFTADQGRVSSNTAQLNNQAGSTLSQVSFTVLPLDVTIAVYYPGGATKTNVGSISTSAAGYGSFQVLGSSGYYQINITTTYRKSGTTFNVTSTHTLQISGDNTSEGKRMIVEEVKDNGGDVAPIVIREEESDVTLMPTSYSAVEGTATWQPVIVTNKAESTLSGVTFTVTSTDVTCGIYYGPEGNRIPNVASGASRSGNFQMLGNVNSFHFNIVVSYRKAGQAYTFSKSVPVLISPAGGASTEGKRAIFGGVATLFPSTENMKAMTVAGLAVGGIALIAIVAVVVAVVVVKRQRTQIIA